MTKSKASKLVKRIQKDRKHANEIVELISFLDGDDEEVLNISLKGLYTFFVEMIKEKGKTKDQISSDETKIYMDWAKERYNEYWGAMISLFERDSPSIRLLSLLTCVTLIEKEIIYMSKPSALYVPEEPISKLTFGLICCDVINTEPELCKNVLSFVDLRYYILKMVTKFISDLADRDDKESITQNVFNILSIISEVITSDGADSTKSLCQGDFKRVFPDFESVANDEEESVTYVKALDARENKRIFGNAWLEFLRLDLNSHLYKSVLVILQSHIIPNSASPCLLADFLTRSFSQGGGIALLSLHGLFVLMTEHNLEYPKFYMHLYSMIHPRIFDARYQSRFFFLLNLFLSSTHLPAYLVAAFAKKLSRLLLVSPTYAQSLLVNFILTLIERHPNIRIMINRSKSGQSKDLSLKTDPYLASQEDPALCKALDSSLWELLALNDHFMPSVSSSVQDLSKGPKQDVLDLLEESYADAFQTLTEGECKEAPMNYRKPVSVFGGFEDSILDLWSV